MTDFVCENTYKWELILNYAKFLKQPLELGMFVPWDEDGNVLEIPDLSDANGRQYDINIDEDKAWVNYIKAKERVLIEGLDLDAVHHHIYMKRNVEYLANFGTLNLTDSAIKKLGL